MIGRVASYVARYLETKRHIKVFRYMALRPILEDSILFKCHLLHCAPAQESVMTRFVTKKKEKKRMIRGYW